MFQSLTLDEIKDRVDSIKVAYDLIAVTLSNGDILLGALGKHWEWDGEIITIGFNTQEGKRFGNSYTVAIPMHLIADIQLIPLDEGSIPRMTDDDSELTLLRELGFAKLLGQTEEEISRLPVQDYPNPLATIICEHNLQIIKKEKLSVYVSVEMALSQDAIPPEGIYLKTDFLLYAEWEFFKRQISGAWGINAGLSSPIVSAKLTKDLSPSLNNFVLGKLRESLSERVRKGIIPQINQDELIQGCILLPDPTEDTEIEGEKCILALCALSNDKDDKVAYPVLIKLSWLKYPLEFLGRINSVLTFYGEPLPIPLNIMGRHYDSSMLVRAIAYLRST